MFQLGFVIQMLKTFHIQRNNSPRNYSVCLFCLCSILIRLTALIKHHLFSVVKETQSEYFITMFCLHSCHEIIQFQHLEPILPQILNRNSDASCVCFLHRLHTAQRAIKQTQVTVQKIGKEIEEKLRTTASCTEKVRANKSN